MRGIFAKIAANNYRLRLKGRRNVNMKKSLKHIWNNLGDSRSIVSRKTYLDKTYEFIMAHPNFFPQNDMFWFREEVNNMQVCHEKLRVGDKILLWGTVSKVFRTTPYEGSNDVELVFEEEVGDPSRISVELQECEVDSVIHKKGVIEKILEWIKGKQRLTEKEMEVLDSI